jgi:hypothetical protein
VSPDSRPVSQPRSAEAGPEMTSGSAEAFPIDHTPVMSVAVTVIDGKDGLSRDRSAVKSIVMVMKGGGDVAKVYPVLRST